MACFYPFRALRWISALAALALLTAAAAFAQNPPHPAAVPPPPPPPAQQIPAPPLPVPQHSFVVVLDPAHGGADNGARLRDGLLEKSVTLSLSLRLRSALRARGISVVITRTTDTAIPELNRAEIANHADAAACLILHATATGSGIHLFTSSLAPTRGVRFLPWQTAQSAYVTRSLRLESEIDNAFSPTRIPVTMAGAAVEPLDHLTCPAVAVELAPQFTARGARAHAIDDPAYQQSVVAALADALAAWRGDWKQQP
jgi:N-acetylmuramoyl-L-alanine amidase